MELRKTLPVIACSLAMLIMILNYVVDQPLLGAFAYNVQYSTGVILNFAIIVGFIALLRVHGNTVSKRRPGWVYSIIMFATLILFLVVGFATGQGSRSYLWLYRGIIVPVWWMGPAVVIFYTTSGMFRAYRARNIEGLIMAVITIITALGRVPLGEMLLPGIFDVGNWISMVPGAAISRGIAISIAVGTIGFAIRVFLGRERRMFGERD